MGWICYTYARDKKKDYAAYYHQNKNVRGGYAEYRNIYDEI